MTSDHLNGFLVLLERSLASESLSSLRDQQLLERFLASRDELAFSVIIARHGHMVYRVCSRLLAEERDSEDAFQAVFLVLIRKANAIRKCESLASWLHGVAVRVALRIRTIAQRRQLRESAAALDEMSRTVDDTTDEDVRAILDEELARMPERFGRPLVLCYLEGLTQEQAAKQLGQSKRTVQRCLERGRVLLGLRLRRRGLTLSGSLLATLHSESADALPLHLFRVAASLLKVVPPEHSMTLAQPAANAARETIQMMPCHSLNLKWYAAALLTMCLGYAFVPWPFADKHQQATPVAIPETQPVLSLSRIEHQAPPGPTDSFEEAIATARNKAIRYLRSRQTKDGHWEETIVTELWDIEGALTALSTLALLEAGVPATDEAIQHAVDYLIKLPQKRTYVVSLQTQILVRVDAKKHKEQIQKNADWLIKEAIGSKGEMTGWSYPGNSIADGSNSYFAVMGLHSAVQGGAKVNEEIWEQIIGLYLRTRKQGWSYYSIPGVDDPPSNSMTACALLGLTLATKHAKAFDRKAVDTAVTKGFEFLGVWDYESTKGTGYAMMVVAELGRARGAKEFRLGEKIVWQWYRSGAEKIVALQKTDGSLEFGKRGIQQMPYLNTAFALYFLGPPEQSGK